MTVGTLAWPLSRLGEALSALAHKSGLSQGSTDLTAPSARLREDDGALGRWLDLAASHLGLEAEPVSSPYADVGAFLRAAAPALVRLPGEGDPRFLLLLRGGRGRVAVLGPDYGVHWLQLEAVRAALCQELEAPLIDEVEKLLRKVGVATGRRRKARAVMLTERLSEVQLEGLWLLRLPPGASFWRQANHAKLGNRLTYLLGAHATNYLLFILSWWVIGNGALKGRLDPGWLLAWALLLLTQVPFQAFTTSLQGSVAVRAGGLLKQRLLYGALRQEPEEMRQQGVGQLLGRVMEANAVESLALSGGFLALIASVELLLALAVLAVGAGSAVHVLLLLGWLAVTVWLGWGYFRRRRRWTEARLGMTHALVEKMAGHRTRLAQEARDHWHDGEDAALEGYLDLSFTMDRGAARLLTLVPRGWLFVGLVGLAPSFIAGTDSTASLAVGLGGVLLAYLALGRVATGLTNVAEAAISWQQIAPLYKAANRDILLGSADPKVSKSFHDDEPREGRRVLEAHDLVFRYHARGEPVLRGCSLSIRAGERLLLEGPSGGGKSTLASLLAGLRQPEAGLLLLAGLDRHTLGEHGWRRRVVAAPQFHENHVLRGTFLFNVLMGRQWPPRRGDMEQALAVCQELGLGDLLERMPGGLWQMVGETGWQLSHGEKSRLYIARALLQQADLIILDESFAALDPENLERALRCVVERAPALLVIAHP